MLIVLNIRGKKAIDLVDVARLVFFIFARHPFFKTIFETRLRRGDLRQRIITRAHNTLALHRHRFMKTCVSIEFICNVVQLRHSSADRVDASLVIRFFVGLFVNGLFIIVSF